MTAPGPDDPNSRAPGEGSSAPVSAPTLRPGDTGRMTWVLESVEDERFPFRLSFQKDGRTVLRLRTQNRWPGVGHQIFCLREESVEAPAKAEVERVVIVSVRRYGKRLAVALDRAVNKRCDFLFLKRPFKNRPGEYEQIFWRTEQALRARRSRARLTARGEAAVRVVVDAKERHAWTFPGCAVERRALPAGDYALVEESGIVAVVERKTLPNFAAEFSRLPLFHQHLTALEAFPHAAVVVEAEYADLLKPGALRVYTPTYAAKVVAELAAFHPRVPFVFVANRKLGREWTLRFFMAIASHRAEAAPPAVVEAAAAYSPGLPFGGGGFWELRRRVIEEFSSEFTFADVKAALPGLSAPTVRNYLARLRAEGILVCRSRGRRSAWAKISAP